MIPRCEKCRSLLSIFPGSGRCRKLKKDWEYSTCALPGNLSPLLSIPFYRARLGQVKNRDEDPIHVASDGGTSQS
jgi:hypothetical protein